MNAIFTPLVFAGELRLLVLLCTVITATNITATNCEAQRPRHDYGNARPRFEMRSGSSALFNPSHHAAGQYATGNGQFSTGQPSAGHFSGGHFSGGHFSADRSGRTVTGISRGNHPNYGNFNSLLLPSLYSNASAYGSSFGYGYPGFTSVYGNGYVAPGYYPSYGVFPSATIVNTNSYHSSYVHPYLLNPYLSYGISSPFVPGCGGLSSFYGITVFATSFPRSSASYTLVTPQAAVAVRRDGLPLMAALGDESEVAVPRRDGTPIVAQLPEVEPAVDRAPVGVADELARWPESGAQPVLNEFPAVARVERNSSLGERIQSLRYQATGDDHFRKGDYASAEVFYRTAVETAPSRRAPYLRMAFVQIAQQQFDRAAGYLKAALLMPEEATRTWVSGDELYGNDFESRSREHAGKLWDWLGSRPLSTDRLLLTGTFQKLRGSDTTADELLQLVRRGNEQELLVAELQRITGGTPPVAADPEKPDPQSSDHTVIDIRRAGGFHSTETRRNPNLATPRLTDAPHQLRESGTAELGDHAAGSRGIFMRGSKLASSPEAVGIKADDRSTAQPLPEVSPLPPVSPSTPGAETDVTDTLQPVPDQLQVPAPPPSTEVPAVPHPPLLIPQ